MRTPLLLATAAFALATAAVTVAPERDRFARNEYNAPVIAESEMHANVYAESDFRANSFRTAESEFRHNTFAVRAVGLPTLA